MYTRPEPYFVAGALTFTIGWLKRFRLGNITVFIYALTFTIGWLKHLRFTTF